MKNKVDITLSSQENEMLQCQIFAAFARYFSSKVKFRSHPDFMTQQASNSIS
jgi:hypothetical protein